MHEVIVLESAKLELSSASSVQRQSAEPSPPFSASICGLVLHAPTDRSDTTTLRGR